MANVLRFFNVFGPLLISVVLIFFAALDIMHDISVADSSGHILFETVVFFLGFLLNLYFVNKTVQTMSGLEQKNEQVSQMLMNSTQENEHLRLEQQKIKEGLHRAIGEQLQTWGLTPSEIEIVFLVLKGLSNKEIAEVRSTSESTVRLQCSSVYKKSKLASRSELAAYFLEDIL